MDIFNEKILSKYTNCYFYYELPPMQNADSVYLVFTVKEKGSTSCISETRYDLAPDASPLTYWLPLFGYEKNETEVFEVFEKLQKLQDVLLCCNAFTKRSITAFLKKETPESLSDRAKLSFDLLKPIVERFPLLACIYKSVFTILQAVRGVLDNPDILAETAEDLVPMFTALSSELSTLKAVYQKTKEYCLAVFQIDNAPRGEISPKLIARMYKDYCHERKLPCYPEHPVLDSSPKEPSGTFLYDVPFDCSWPEYYEDITESIDIYYYEDYNDPDFECIALMGIKALTETESVLRKCKMCGKTFHVKYSSSQECCTRVYEGTKATCNEYASRKNYKQKLFAHPIHQQFTKSYNKLYGFIRRGKLPANTPLMDQLKALHDSYTALYDSAAPEDRDAVLNEYIDKNKELLA